MGLFTGVEIRARSMTDEKCTFPIFECQDAQVFHFPLEISLKEYKLQICLHCNTLW